MSEFDRLPPRFKLSTARRLLAWQGTDRGLSRVLSNGGFWRVRTAKGFIYHRANIVMMTGGEPIAARFIDDAPTPRGRRLFQDTEGGPSQLPPECACQCHENTCGAAAMDMAERTLRLIISLRPIGADMVDRLDELVTHAGPAHARALLKNFSPDDGVPC
ncbi:hypothetical protein ACQR50_09135 [Sphingomonas sp. Xoc002]|uniref:hypothetical protein n=1 Tax=Sphingomonas sp. Xoc002 TaxID=2837624 RepID=UPI003D181E0F